MIAVDQRGPVAVVTLAHGKANALDIEICRALTGHFDKLRKSKAQAVVITGAGSMFSAGVNLVRACEGGTPYLRKFLPVLNKLYATVFAFPKPVVAAINGHAIAGGCVLACSADYRMMAADSGRIGVTELAVGLPFPALMFEIMRSVTALRYFPELIYTGQTYVPDAAVERGMVHEIVEPSDLLERAIAAANMLAAIPASAFAQTKQQMQLPITDRMKRDGKRVDAAITKIWTNPKAVAAIEAYVDRTLRKS